MTAQKSLLNIVVASGFAFASFSVMAGVKSMSSDEMTETFIKDTTIIVTPAQRSDADREKDKEKSRTSLTISPGEAEKSEAELQAGFEENKDKQDRQLDAAIANYEEQARRDMILREVNEAQFPAPDLSQIYPERAIPNIPGFEVPEGDFANILGNTYIGNQLGLSRNDNQLTMSFGNSLPGVNGINMPRAINEGPIQLTPRPGGGFDLVIDIPQN